MKKEKSLLKKPDRCPYLKNPDCGRPDKDPAGVCSFYRNCISYKYLEEFKEDKNYGKAESGISVD